MINLVTNNPYRVLGVYSNSPKKDVLSNLSKMKAFIKVGKSMSFSSDLPSILPTIVRSEEALQKAQSAVELPMDQIKYSMFWFMKATPFDDIAFNHLQSGDIASAKDIWSKKESVSSLLNLIVCSFIENRSSDIAIYADKLFQNYGNEFCQVVNETVKLNQTQLIDVFIDSISSSGTFDISTLINVSGTSGTWNASVGKRLVQPIIDEITSSIAEATQANGAMANYDAGIKLMDGTKDSLAKLKSLLGSSNPKYQLISDKLAQAILQCSINYFNDANSYDASERAISLINYALPIAFSQITIDRCIENINILKKNIANLPPKEIANEVKLIQVELEKSCKSPDLIKHAITLLSNVKPHLDVIKEKIGVTNPLYLKLSSRIVGNALNNIIEEVNSAQEYNPDETEIRSYPGGRAMDDNTFGLVASQYYHDRSTISMNHLYELRKREHIISVLYQAWEAVKLMRQMDLEESFKRQKYTPNIAILKEMCEKSGVKTSTTDEKIEQWLFVVIAFVIFEIIVILLAFNCTSNVATRWYICLCPLLPFPPVIFITYLVCGSVGKWLWKLSGRDEIFYDII
jgi:hypothetical protein